MKIPFHLIGSSNKNICGIGIYSFPKSGNTWLREIIKSGFCFDGRLRDLIPDAHQGPIGHNILNWPKSIKKNNVNTRFEKLFFYKSHTSRLIETSHNKKISTNFVIHIRRNPLDVFVSYLNYISDNQKGNGRIRFSSVDDIAGTKLFYTYFNTFCLLGHVQPNFRASGSWFDHNKYWLSNDKKIEGTKIVSIRYEDLVFDFDSTINKIRTILDFEKTNQTIYNEAELNTKVNGGFFWRKSVGNFRNYLSSDDVAYFTDLHAENIKECGYGVDEIKAYFDGSI